MQEVNLVSCQTSIYGAFLQKYVTVSMLLRPLFSGGIEAVISKSSNQGFNSRKVY